MIFFSYDLLDTRRRTIFTIQMEGFFQGSHPRNHVQLDRNVKKNKFKFDSI